MAAIISDKFRIFNAKQFLESLSEGPNDTSAERTRMYFFVSVKYLTQIKINVAFNKYIAMLFLQVTTGS